MRFKQKLIEVSPELFKQVKDVLGRKGGRTTENDVNKELEEALCRAFFSKDGVTAEVTSAPADEDIIDYADGSVIYQTGQIVGVYTLDIKGIVSFFEYISSLFNHSP